MPFPTTSETCYVAPPTSVPTFPPTPSLAPAAFPRPFPSLLECFLSFRTVLFTLASLPARCHQYLDQTPTPARASPPSLLSPSISPISSRNCCHSMSPPDTAVAKTCPCSTFGAWLSDGFAAGSVLGGTGDLGAEQGLSPALASLLAGCHDSGGCDSQQSSLTQPMGFLLWTKQNLQSWVLLGPLSRGSGFCCHLLLQSDALPFWLELCASWSRHCIANKLRAQFCTPQR